MEPTEEQILEAAKTKHGIINTDEQSLLALIRYARHIGYNEGWEDHKNATKEKWDSYGWEI